MEEDNDGEGGSTSSPTMTTISRHFFGDASEEPSFTISIIENMKEEYGLFVWPCSVVLAEYVWQQRSRFTGIRVLECLYSWVLGLLCLGWLLQNWVRMCHLLMMPADWRSWGLRGESGMLPFSVYALRLYLEQMCCMTQGLSTTSLQLSHSYFRILLAQPS